jgi:hypothetical protein
MRYAPLFIIALLAPALTGCIIFETKKERAMVKTPEFQAGYSDGCASANARGTNYRNDKIQDDALYKISQAYRSGWGAGYSTCNNQYGRQSNPNSSDMPDQRPGL